MYNEGGWYTDARMECYKSLDDLDALNKEFYVCVDTPQQQLCMTTGFIGSIPKHPISKKMIDIILWNIANRHYGMDCLAPTGPGAYINACIDHVRKFPHACLIGKHVIDNGEQFIDFDRGRFAKVKYNNARGADNSDLAGTNDYGKMWRNFDIYHDI